MKLLSLSTICLSCSAIIDAASIRSTKYSANGAISRRGLATGSELLNAPVLEPYGHLSGYLEKRRGGGGSGGGGGRASSGGSSGSVPAVGSSSSGSGSSAGKAGGAGGAGGSRNTGSASSSSAVGPSYGGGKYYGGGSTSAYRAGSRSPGGILPFALAGGALAFFPGIWLYGAYVYNYDNRYSFHNRTNTTEPADKNETLPVTCLCGQYQACGCDDNVKNSTYLDSVIGNGSMADENSTLVHVGIVNGTKKIILNGTLPNGTDTSTVNGSTGTTTTITPPATSAGKSFQQTTMEMSGFWLLAGIVGATVWLL